MQINRECEKRSACVYQLSKQKIHREGTDACQLKGPSQNLNKSDSHSRLQLYSDKRQGDVIPRSWRGMAPPPTTWAERGGSPAPPAPYGGPTATENGLKFSQKLGGIPECGTVLMYLSFPDWYKDPQFFASINKKCLKTSFFYIIHKNKYICKTSAHEYSMLSKNVNKKIVYILVRQSEPNFNS